MSGYLMRAKSLKIFLIEYYPSFIVATIMLGLSLMLQSTWCQSMFHAQDEFWAFLYGLHTEVYPFATRYFTNQYLIIMGNITNLTLPQSFFILQFTLFYLCGPAFFGYLKALKFTSKMALSGEIIFYLMYPVIAAHIPPVFTWDDMWVYLFLTLSLTFIFKKRAISGSVFFILALYAREQTVILFPVYALAVWLNRDNRNYGRDILALLLPILIYAPFYLAFHWGLKPLSMVHINYNFEYASRISNTIFSTLGSFGCIWVASTLALRTTRFPEYGHVGKFLFYSYFLAVPVTLVFVTLYGRLVETRLLFPPFVILIPLGVIYLKRLLSDALPLPTGKARITMISVMFILAAIGVWLGWTIFSDFDYRECSDFARNHIGINFGATMIMILLSAYSKYKRSKL